MVLRDAEDLPAFFIIGVCTLVHPPISAKETSFLFKRHALESPPYKKFDSSSIITHLTSLGPSPKYFWINSLPTTLKNVAEVWFATA